MKSLLCFGACIKISMDFGGSVEDHVSYPNYLDTLSTYYTWR